jgi:hypothetical protein
MADRKAHVAEKKIECLHSARIRPCIRLPKNRVSAFGPAPSAVAPDPVTCHRFRFSRKAGETGTLVALLGSDLQPKTKNGRIWSDCWRDALRGDNVVTRKHNIRPYNQMRNRYEAGWIALGAPQLAVWTWFPAKLPGHFADRF